MNIAQQLKQCEKKIEKLRFELAVEEAVYERLRLIDNGHEPSLFGNTQPTTPGSMPNHIEAVLIKAEKAMEIPDIIKAVKDRGATGKTDKALENNVRGTLKRRTDLFERVDRGKYALKNKAQAEQGEMK